MSVTGPGHVQGSFPVRPAQPTPPPTPSESTQPSQQTDEVEISSAGRMLDKIQQSGEVRTERLAQIKAAIEAGEYETPEKLEAALNRMMSQIEAEGDER